MKYAQALEYIADCRHLGSVPGLESTKELLRRLGSPEQELSFIHIAGTNGKGSVLGMISCVLAAAGYRTGRYLSPVISDYRERYWINGKLMAKAELGRYMEIVRDAAESMEQDGLAHPTVFEMETALGFLWFRDKKCDLVVAETGMGGLLDATNVIPPPLLCVLTSISMDHMSALGGSLREIAEQKAGIVKPGSRVVSVKQPEQAMEVIRDTCGQLGCPLRVADPQRATGVRRGLERQRLSYGGYQGLMIPLAGQYQIDNCVTAIEALQTLMEMGYAIPEEKLRAGLADVKWPGRFQVIAKNPLFVSDGAHNADGAKRLAESVRLYFTNRRIIYIIGILKDKEAEKILEATCGCAAALITVSAGENPRGIPAIPAIELAELARSYHENVTAADSLEEAVEMALLLAGPQDVVIAFGSLSFQGELLKIVQNGGIRRGDTHDR